MVILKKIKYMLIVIMTALFLSGCDDNMISVSVSKEKTETTSTMPPTTETEKPKEPETTENVFSAGDFTLTLPENWAGKYEVAELEEEDFELSCVAFYAKKCYDSTDTGWLFTIGRFTDTSYEEYPSYEIVGEWNGVTYVAIFPTDVQSEGVSKEAQEEYHELVKDVEDVVKTIKEPTLETTEETTEETSEGENKTFFAGEL